MRSLYGAKIRAPPGVADANDRLIGLLITTGGSTLTDQVGAKLASSIGAAGGFMYADSNPASPAAATTVVGAAGGWRIDLTAAGWSTLGTLAKAGHIGVLVSLVPSGTGIGGGGGTSIKLDDLTDARTNYTAGNLFAGEYAGDGNTTGSGNTGVGPSALRAVTGSIGNAAFGTGALDRHTLAASVYGYHTAIGADALGNLLTGFNFHTAIGARAMASQNGGRGSMGIGYEALYSSGGLDGTTAVGHRALRTVTGQHGNTCIGAFCMYTVNNSGNNTAIGAYALYNFNVWNTGSNVAIGAYVGSSLYSPHSGGAKFNTLIGYQAGSNLTTGENNIIIGASINATSATTSNQINIGNTIYGNSSTKTVSLGTTASSPDIAFDTNSTNSSRLSSGTSAQRPACTASLVGAQRWNRIVQSLEFCDGSSWLQLPLTYGSGTPPEPPVGSGFVVLTQSRWNGNLGGQSGANSKCYNELTSNTNWMYYNLALSRGQLTPAKVVAKLVTTPGAASGVYYFSRVGDITIGGGAIELDSTGDYSGSNAGAWSGKNYFGGSFNYWTGNHYGNTWRSYQNNQSKCDPMFTSNSSSLYGSIGASTANGQGRWWNSAATCDNLLPIMCLVNP